MTEAQERFPRSVTCSTAHSLAFRAVGKHYAHRLKAPRMRSLEILLETGGLQDAFGPEEKERLASRKNGWYVEYLMAMDESELLDGAVGPTRGAAHAVGAALRRLYGRSCAIEAREVPALPPEPSGKYLRAAPAFAVDADAFLDEAYRPPAPGGG